MFYHPDKKLQIVSHVDDFLCAGDAADLWWLRSQLKEGYEVDGDVLGLRDGESAEGKFLGRILRYTPEGIEWEADPKQVTSLVAEFGMEDCSGVDTPGVKSEVEMKELAGLVEAREPLLPKVWGFVDGLNLRIENPADDLRQNAMYNALRK